jgi:hypothetical protein
MIDRQHRTHRDLCCRPGRCARDSRAVVDGLWSGGPQRARGRSRSHGRPEGRRRRYVFVTGNNAKGMYTCSTGTARCIFRPAACSMKAVSGVGAEPSNHGGFLASRTGLRPRPSYHPCTHRRGCGSGPGTADGRRIRLARATSSSRLGRRPGRHSRIHRQPEWWCWIPDRTRAGSCRRLRVSRSAATV